MKIFVCVGSSCHLKGSYEVLEKLKEEVAKRQLEDQIEISASFCLGKCDKGVSIKVDDIFLENANESNILEKFETEILPLLAK